MEDEVRKHQGAEDYSSWVHPLLKVETCWVCLVKKKIKNKLEAGLQLKARDLSTLLPVLIRNVIGNLFSSF